MVKKYFKKINTLRSGFTLVETLVAISIFTVSILAMLVVLSQGISNTSYAKQKIVASYLAQEGIEYARNMRDTYMLYSGNSSAGWDGFWNQLIAGHCWQDVDPNGCYFDNRNVTIGDQNMPMKNLVLSACSDSTCSNAPLLYEPSVGAYGYASGTNSGFTRKLRVTRISVDEIKVFSTVFWKQGSGNFSVTFAESVFDWIE